MLIFQFIVYVKNVFVSCNIMDTITNKLTSIKLQKDIINEYLML